MKNIRKSGHKFQAHVYCLGVRAIKTFASEGEAAAWVAERKQEIRLTGRLAAIKTARARRVDYGAILMPKKAPPDLLTAGAIVAASKPHRPLCGVYFLVAEGRVMYIGQSIDVHVRLAAHAWRRDFDSFHVIECAESALSHLEARYILALRPPWNMTRGGAIKLPMEKALVSVL